MKLKKYSVLLLYPDYSDGPETYLAHVRAANPTKAVTAARAEAAEANGFEDDDDPTDFGLLLTVEGHVKDLGGDQ